MKKICYGFALLLFGLLLSNIPSEILWMVAILFGVVGLIVLAVGLVQTDGKRLCLTPSTEKAKDSEPSETDKTTPPSSSNQ